MASRDKLHCNLYNNCVLRKKSDSSKVIKEDCMNKQLTVVALAVVCSLVAGIGYAQDDKAPINIKLPKPMFVGTPKDIKSPNLETPRKAGELRPAFLAPKGATNLALKKSIKTSDSAPVIGETELIADGDKEGLDGSYVEFGPGKQYVQIDLGTESEIYAVVVWHYHEQARVYRDVVVQSSNEPDFLVDVKTIFNNDHDNSSGLGIGKDKEYIESYEGKLIDAQGVKGRYVRLYSDGNTANEMNHYIEVEVYGKPAK